METAPDQELEALLAYLKEQRGFDFSGYKRPSLTRRIRARMSALGVESFPEYQDRLEVDPEEFVHLFNTILINVTGFFRDPPAWQLLADTLLPQLVAARGDAAPLRGWSAGCASGEEAYSLAMLLAEALRLEQCRERVKIYGSDVDEEILLKARVATYTAREVAEVPPELLERYFTAQNGQYVFHKELRRCVIFGRHDLIQDVPLSRIDLLVCRNTLMYFNADTQAEVLTRLHRALNEQGYLFLGKAETLLSLKSSFVPVDLKHRFFTKGTEPPRGLQPPLALGRSGAAMNHQAGDQYLRDSAFEEAPLAQIVIARDGRLAFANQRARLLFALSAADLGRPLQDLDLSYRPVELRAAIERVYAAGGELRLPPVEWFHSPMGALILAVRLQTLHRFEAMIGVCVAFEDVTEAQRLAREVQRATEEERTAQEELQSANEELETTNEELQSTVEELETTNEELQSSNEEMETMNEELHSTNEELQTVNDELRRRTEELDQANRFLGAILDSLKGGMAVLDRELRVLVWSRQAEELWGARSDETRERHFFNLDIGLPVGRLIEPLQACLQGTQQEVTLQATNRRGRTIRCHVTCTPLNIADGRSDGAIVMMDTVSAEERQPGDS